MSEEHNIKKSESEAQKGIPTLVTPLSTIATQVGEHVLSAIHNNEETVAVITTVTGSKQGPQVISIPLTAEHMQQQQKSRAVVTTLVNVWLLRCVAIKFFSLRMM